MHVYKRMGVGKESGSWIVRKVKLDMEPSHLTEESHILEKHIPTSIISWNSYWVGESQEKHQLGLEHGDGSTVVTQWEMQLAHCHTQSQILYSDQ